MVIVPDSSLLLFQHNVNVLYYLLIWESKYFLNFADSKMNLLIFIILHFIEIISTKRKNILKIVNFVSKQIQETVTHTMEEAEVYFAVGTWGRWCITMKD